MLDRYPRCLVIIELLQYEYFRKQLSNRNFTVELNNLIYNFWLNNNTTDNTIPPVNEITSKMDEDIPRNINN